MERYSTAIASEQMEYSMVISILTLLYSPEFCTSEQVQLGYCIGSHGRQDRHAPLRRGLCSLKKTYLYDLYLIRLVRLRNK